MSAFILKADYGNIIRQGLLDAIIEADDAKLDSAELEAIAEVKSYLNTRYDIAAIFSAVGGARHPKVVACCCSLALYRVHMLLAPSKVPDYRKEDRKECLQWLRNLQSGLLDDPDLPRPEAPAKIHVGYSSKKKKDYRI